LIPKSPKKKEGRTGGGGSADRERKGRGKKEESPVYSPSKIPISKLCKGKEKKKGEGTEKMNTPVLRSNLDQSVERKRSRAK